METYHIGEEINKEMRRQGMKPSDFARALNKERPTIYDIFKKRHIATDTLTDICRVLNHDFFSELSRANFNWKENETEEKEDSEELKEAVSGLTPETELHVFRINYMLQEVVEEYLIGNRQKPLIICCPSSKLKNSPFSLPNITEQLALKLQDKEYENHRCNMVPFGQHLEISSDIPLVTSLVLKDRAYNFALQQAEKLMQKNGTHVILYISNANGIDEGYAGGLVYEDLAEELFEAWKGRVHFAVAATSGYIARREYYKAYRRVGAIDRLIESLNAGKELNSLLFNLIFGNKILDVEEIKEEDSTGLSRIRIFYNTSETMSKTDYKKLFENGINDNPRLDMWLDIRNGYLVDFQYNKRTQS